MKIVYYSIPPFADCDFPLIRAMRAAGHEVYYIVRLAPFFMKTTLLAFDSMVDRSCILPASAYPQFNEWGDWIDLTKSYVSNDAEGKTGPASFRLFLEEMKLIDSIGPDIVHYVSVPMVFHLVMMAKYRRKSVCVIHDPLPHSGEKSLRNTLKRKCLALISPKIILLNDLQTDAFCRNYGFRRDRVFYSSLGPYECTAQFRTGRKFDWPFIIIVGRLSPYKGIDYALEAFSSVHDKHPEVKLVIAGAGPVCFDWDKYKQTGDVIFINRYFTMNEMADYVSEAQFAVCPYTDATQSGVLQTVMALGTPAVVTSVGTMPRIVRDGVNGIVVQPRDSESLVVAFDTLLSDESLLKAMRENIRSMNSDGVDSWAGIVEKYISAYEA